MMTTTSPMTLLIKAVAMGWLGDRVERAIEFRKYAKPKAGQEGPPR